MYVRCVFDAEAVANFLECFGVFECGRMHVFGFGNEFDSFAAIEDVGLQNLLKRFQVLAVHDEQLVFI